SLHAALCLARFGRLGAEAIDEGLEPLALIFLARGERLLAREMLAPRAREVLIAAAIERQPLLAEMKDVIDDLVEELPVVADEQQRVAIAAQEIGEPQRGFEIEVIGRLVEQQQLGLGEKHAGKRDTHTPAAGEIRQRLILLVVVEAEAGEDAGSARFRRMSADRGEPLVDFRDTRCIAAVLGLGEEALALV